jgi:hypothetical protein
LVRFGRLGCSGPTAAGTSVLHHKPAREFCQLAALAPLTMSTGDLRRAHSGARTMERLEWQGCNGIYRRRFPAVPPAMIMFFSCGSVIAHPRPGYRLNKSNAARAEPEKAQMRLATTPALR